jgi:hypothetical protein
MSGAFVKKFDKITITELKKILKGLDVPFESNASKDTLYAMYVSIVAPEEFEDIPEKKGSSDVKDPIDKSTDIKEPEKKEKVRKKEDQDRKKYMIYMTFITNYYSIPSSEYKDIYQKRKYKTSYPGTYLAEEADIDNHIFIYHNQKAFELAIAKLTAGFYKLNYTDPDQVAQIINLFKGERDSGELDGYRVDDITKGEEKVYKLGKSEAAAFDTLDFTDLEQDDYESSLSHNRIVRNIAALKVFQVYINKLWSASKEPQEEAAAEEEEEEEEEQE